MRRQAYEWRAIVPSSDTSPPNTLNLQPVLTSDPVIPAIPGNPRADYDIFVGGYGTNLDIPAFIKATQFIVIDELSCWPPAATVQPWIETTKFFQNPDGSVADGLSGYTSPFIPTGGTTASPIGLKQSYLLSESPIYVMPGQTWGVYWSLKGGSPVSIPSTTGPVTVDYTIDNALISSTGDLPIPRVYLEYILFDGPDALIAYKLINNGYAPTVDAVQAYKRMLIKSKLYQSIATKESELIDTIPRRFS